MAFGKRIPGLQRWVLGFVKIKLCELPAGAEAHQFSSVIQIAYKLECSGRLDWNGSRCLDFCGICDIEDGKPCAIVLLNVEIGFAISRLIEEERLPWSLRHLGKIHGLLND